VKNEMVGEGWTHAKAHVWQTNGYWLFKKSESGWVPVSHLLPEEAANEVPGPRAKVGTTAVVIRPRTGGLDIQRVSDVGLVPDTREEIRRQARLIASEARVRRERMRQVPYLLGAVVLIAVGAMVIVASRRRRGRAGLAR